jgi:hypothetical protein
MSTDAEQIKVRVAEAMGWKFDHRYKGSRQYAEIIVIAKDGKDVGSVFPGDLHTARGREMLASAGIPDYPNSLDACAQFEATLTEDEWDNYCDELLWADGRAGHSNYTACRVGLTATPLQRCKAFLAARSPAKEGKNGT